MIHKEWFQEWFGTKYYKLLYHSRNETEADLFTKNLVSSINIPKNSKVLDVACGNGRHSEALSQYVGEVIGIDINHCCISEAQYRENPGLSFFQHDMRRIFRINYFDVCLSLFTSFGYFHRPEDERKAAYCLSANLKKNGFLIFDFLNADLLIRQLVPKEIYNINQIQFEIFKEIRDQKIIKQIIIKDDTGVHHFQERVWLYNQKSLLNLFLPYRLKMVNCFGNYDLSTFKPNSSPRLILIFEKF